MTVLIVRTVNFWRRDFLSMKPKRTVRERVEPQIDYSYRPTSYWRATSLHQLVANIKGAERKKRALRLIQRGRLEEASDFVLCDCLSDDERCRLGKVHPALMGGEYLPDCDAQEVEIARVTMASVTRDVISIRAYPSATPTLIRYRVVDEYQTSFKIRPACSKQPLSLGQLVRLIETARGDDLQSIGLGIIQTLFDNTEDPADAFADFLNFSSEFYLDLSKHYSLATQQWLAENRSRRVV